MRRNSFRSLHLAGCVKRYLTRFAALQDALGWLNDAAVADRLLREFETSHPELAGSASFKRGYLCAATTQDLLGLAKLAVEAVQIDGVALRVAGVLIARRSFQVPCSAEVA
jgi:hypothetical protein